jgi:acetyl esterase/lipase
VQQNGEKKFDFTPRTMTPYPTEIPPEVELLRDVQFGGADGRTLLLDIALPREGAKAGRPALVYFHGGAWRSGSKADGVPAICFYAQHGFVAASAGYRLSAQAQFPAQIEDCKCAVRFLRAKAAGFGIDSERIGVMGSSAGGHLAALLALTAGRGVYAARGGWENFPDHVAAVCDLFGLSDFLRMPPKQFPDEVSSTARLFGGTLDELRDKYIEASPVNHAHADAPPFLLVHGDADELIPLEQSVILCEALKKAGADVTLHVVKGAGHGSLNVVNEEVRARILAFFDQHLKGTGR